ncbi:uncharacterized protein [Brachyistius frenatus]|uniref:uncharacterized protein n=1 Tax=Brachyistius frenatus TaxID=100188 RepID=UPI0037E8DD55
MALADPCSQKELGKWEREMEKRRRRWKEKALRWIRAEDSDEEEEDEVGEEGEYRYSGEGDVNEEEGEGESGGICGSDRERRLKEDKREDEEGDGEMTKAEERVAVEEEEETEVEVNEEREVEETDEVDEEEEWKVREAEEMEKRRRRWKEKALRWIRAEDSDSDEDEEDRVGEEGKYRYSGEEDVNEEEEEGESGGIGGSDRERRLKEDKREDEEGDGEMTKAEERVAVEKEEETEVEVNEEREVEETDEVDEEEELEVREAEEMEEGENDVRTDAEESEEEVGQVSEEQEEELQEQEESLRYWLKEQFGEEGENIQQNQEDEALEEEENLSSSVHDEDSDSTGPEALKENLSSSEESMHDEDSDSAGPENENFNLERLDLEDQCVEKQLEDPDERKDPGEKPRRKENGAFGARTSQERDEEEDESQKLTDEAETVTESWTTPEEFLDDCEDAQEGAEESTNDEEAEDSGDEDSDEEEEKIYCKDDYPTDVFRTLNEFRDSSLLTDMTLSTEDGKSVCVHSSVLAAVSSFILTYLGRSKAENYRHNRGFGDDTSAGVHTWSVSLGPELDSVGLEAIVEFAYTGLVSCLNEDNVRRIKAAAQTLGAPRVMKLCTEEEERPATTEGQEKKEKITAAEQMKISLQAVKQLWMDGAGCDVTLEAVGASLNVHRVILAVSSDYFRGMFTLGMKETNQSRVSLPFLSASELEVLIGCSYSGALPLSWRCIFEITTTALQLQYRPALSLCLNFLSQEINHLSCLDVVSFAEAYEMGQLLEVADDYVLRQFQKVACTSKFKDLPAKQLLGYLKSRSLCVPSELVVFRAVVTWIQAKPKFRLRLTKVLMETIHFPLMTFKEFKEVKSQNMWSDHRLAELYEAIFEDFCSTETAPHYQCRIYLPKESLVLIGGDHISEDMGSRAISRDLWFGNSLRNHTGIKKAMEWIKLGEMPEPARFCHEVAVLEGQLYVFGGKKYYGLGDTLNSVHRYNPLQNSWECLAEMQLKRSCFSVVVLYGKMYAIGGHCDPDFIDSVERYCPSTNSWSFTWPLDLPISGHVAKVSQGQIFVSGGRNGDYSCLASMFLYRPDTGSTYLANMTKPRAHHCMETLNGFLYVAGGITTNDDVTVVDQLACEVYSPATDTWYAFTSLPMRHVGAGSAVLEGKFYVLGGYSQEDCSETKSIHRYDAATYRWENMGRMPGPNNDIRAALLCLPQHFRV